MAPSISIVCRPGPSLFHRPAKKVGLGMRLVHRVGVGIMSQLSIVALFLEMDYLRILKIAPDIK